MTLSDEFMQSTCTDKLEKRIIEVISNKELTDAEKMTILVKYIREEGSS